MSPAAHVTRLALLGPLAVLAGACAAAAGSDGECVFDAVAWAAPPGALFAGGLETGCDAAEIADSWRAGDRVWFAVELETASAREAWAVRFRLAAEPAAEPGAAAAGEIQRGSGSAGDSVSIRFSSARLELEVTTFDGAGQVVDTERVPYLADYLAAGFAGACAGTPAAASDEERLEALRRAIAAVLAMDALMKAIQGVDALQSILWRVASTPSLASLVFRLGATVGVRAAFDDAEPCDVAAAGVPGIERGWSIPVEITANDEPVAHCRMIAVEPAPPVLLCGGVLAIDACRAGDPATRLRIRLLGARRGP